MRLLFRGRIQTLFLLIFYSPFFLINAAPRIDAERGVLLFQEGRYQEAQKAFETAVQEDPGDLRAWQDLGWTHYRLGEIDTAIAIWRDILTTEQGFLRAHNALGQALLETGDSQQAAKHLEQSLALDPQQPNVWIRLGEAYEASGDLEKAQAVYREVIQNDGSNHSAHMHLAGLLEKSGEIEMAISLLSDYLEKEPEDSGAVRSSLARLSANRGSKEYSAGKFSEAAEWFGKAAALQPDDPRYVIDSGWAAYHSGDAEGAIEYWRKASRMNPPAPGKLFLAMADASRDLNRLEDARRYYNNALSFQEDDPSTLFKFALYELDFGDLPSGVSLLGRLLDLPDLESQWVPRITNELLLRDHADSAESLLQENATAPGVSEGLEKVYHHLGVQAYNDDRLDDAVERFQQALDRDPDSMPVLRDLGWAFWRSGNLDACGATWNTLAETHPDFAVAHDLLAQYYLQKGDFVSAEKEALACLEKDPGYLPAKKHLARVLVDSERPGEARADLEMLCREFPNDVGLQQLYGLALTKLLDVHAASRQWARVLELNPGSEVAQVNWIDSLYQSGYREKALTEARHRSADPDTPPEILEILAHDAFRREEYSEAEKWFDRLADEYPENPGYRMRLSDCLLAQEKHEERLEMLQNAVSRRPDRFDLQLALCDALNRRGLEERTDQAYKQLIRNHPDSYLAYEGYLYFLRKTGRYQEALELLDHNKPTFFQPHEELFQRADLLRQMGQYLEAEKLLSGLTAGREETVFLPILVYHGLSMQENSSDISVARFADQMAALEDQGYTTLTMSDLLHQIQQGKITAEKPILITFDDARTDSFFLADPILDHHGFKATMFVPSSRIGGEDLYHAGRATIRKYADSGRWEMQSHGHDAHNWIVVTPEEHPGAFLAARRWLPDQNRFETETEFRERISGDYDKSARILTELSGGREVVGYAFPYSDYGQNADNTDFSLAEANISALRDIFTFGLIQRTSGYNGIEPGAPMPGLLRRFTVPNDWSGQELVEYLAADQPENRAVFEMAKGARWEGRYEKAAHLYQELEERDPMLSGESALARAQIAVQRGRPEEAHGFLKELGEAVPEYFPLERLAWQTDPQVAGNLHFWEDSSDRRFYFAGAEAQIPLTGVLRGSVDAGSVNLEENGFPDDSGYQVGAGLNWVMPASLSSAADVQFREMENAEDSVTGGVRVRWRQNLHDISSGWEYRNIDTLRAQMAGIRFHRISGDYYYHSADWPLSFRVMHWDMNDGNQRRDLRALLFRRINSLPGWRIGGSIEYADNDFESPDYYTPQDLIAPRAVLRYDYNKAENWSAGAEAGVGIVLDEPNDDRATFRGGAHGSWDFDANTRLSGSIYYSTTAGYTLSGAEITLRRRF